MELARLLVVLVGPLALQWARARSVTSALPQTASGPVS
jgi:hypothetical protein